MDANEAKLFIKELRDDIARMKRSRRRPPFEAREVIYTKTEMARTLGLSRMSIYRYMDWFPDFPRALPTFKWVLRNWAAKRGIPRKPGPAPSVRRTRPAGP